MSREQSAARSFEPVPDEQEVSQPSKIAAYERLQAERERCLELIQASEEFDRLASAAARVLKRQPKPLATQADDEYALPPIKNTRYSPPTMKIDDDLRAALEDMAQYARLAQLPLERVIHIYHDLFAIASASGRNDEATWIQHKMNYLTQTWEKPWTASTTDQHIVDGGDLLIQRDPFSRPS